MSIWHQTPKTSSVDACAHIIHYRYITTCQFRHWWRHRRDAMNVVHFHSCCNSPQSLVCQPQAFLTPLFTLSYQSSGKDSMQSVPGHVSGETNSNAILFHKADVQQAKHRFRPVMRRAFVYIKLISLETCRHITDKTPPGPVVNTANWTDCTNLVLRISSFRSEPEILHHLESL